VAKTVTQVRLRADEAGYTCGGCDVVGFADDPKLTLPQRRRIARWAAKFGQPSAEQRALLDRPTPETSAQRALARAPGTHPELAGRVYPLTLGEVATLAGCTARKVRHWHDLGLLPARRDHNDQKWFGPAAVIRAMWLTQTNQHTISTLGALADERGIAPLLAAFGEVLHDVAARSVPPLLDVEHLADEMQAVSVSLLVG